MTVLASCAIAVPHRYVKQSATRASFFTTTFPPSRQLHRDVSVPGWGGRPPETPKINTMAPPYLLTVTGAPYFDEAPHAHLRQGTVAALVSESGSVNCLGGHDGVRCATCGPGVGSRATVLAGDDRDRHSGHRVCVVPLRPAGLSGRHVLRLSRSPSMAAR